MRTNRDLDNNGWVIIFFILFFLFIVLLSDHSQSISSSPGRSVQTELTFTNLSDHSATIPGTIYLSDLYKINAIPAGSAEFMKLPSLPDKLSDYNNKTDHKLIELQKIRLFINPVFLRKLKHSLPASEKDDLPDVG